MAQQEAFDFPEEPVASHRASEPSRPGAYPDAGRAPAFASIAANGCRRGPPPKRHRSMTT